MRVLLKRTWFSGLGRGRRFKKSVPASHPVEIPDELQEFLPPDAVVVDEGYQEPKPEKPAETLSEVAKAHGADPARAAAEAYGKVVEAADGNRGEADADKASKAAKFQADLAAEGKSNGGFKRVRGRQKKS